jgi:fatty-acyl-CoA synthase
MTTKVMNPSNQAEAPSRAWLRALERTAAIPRNPHRLLSSIVEELADQIGDAPALLSDRECYTYSELMARTNQYARWALEQNLGKGEVVGLLMTNRPEYFACWLGVAAAGGVVALLNTNLIGSSLSHCINVVRPKQLIVAGEFVDSLTNAVAGLSCEPKMWVHGQSHDTLPRVDYNVQQLPTNSLVGDAEVPKLSVNDVALNIYTSGTTGLPKAANVSHARILQWSQWFAGMLNVQQDDRIYNCLPMYHSIGGVLVPGAALSSGASVVIRESFSASRFWDEVALWDCTMFQYIGEFCRYLLHAPPVSNHLHHRIRIACGNGMSADVWRVFQERFQIPRILEFYASTEGALSLFNVEGEPGSIGRVPAYLTHRYSPVLAKFDPERAEPVRDERGFCIPCEPNEPGEALARIVSDPMQVGSRFEGYTDTEASERKLLRDVFEPGDLWFRTGDLMRRNEKGFFYFVDRVGETFRWKGENVATTEVAEVLCAFPGVKHAIVYGVKIAGAEGRIGMAALSFDGEPNLDGLRRHLIRSLPTYARPAFIRIHDNCEVTGTFKYSKNELVRQGYNPELTSDAIYFDNPETQILLPLDRALYERIQAGQIRL